MNWKDLIRNIAPAIGTALGTPVTGLAVKFLADKFLGNPNATEQEVADAVLGASPEKLLEIKKLDQQFAVQMKSLDIDVFKMEVEDRKSARELAKVDMRPHIYLSGIYTVGYFVVLYLFMTGGVQIAASVETAFNIVLGVMTAAQVKIMDFWFGSSYGSKVKDAKG